jgi:hypothetical protein
MNKVQPVSEDTGLVVLLNAEALLQVDRADTLDQLPHIGAITGKVLVVTDSVDGLKWG